MLERLMFGWLDCADYSNGNLEVTVEQWKCDIYGLFIVRKVNPSLEQDIDCENLWFSLSNTNIKNGIFEIKGIEYQMIAGLIVDEQFDGLIGAELFEALPPQNRFGINVYKVPIEKNYLRKLLRDNECYMVASFAHEFLEDGHHLALNEGVPKGYEFPTTANPIEWEHEGVVIDCQRYRDIGLCEHKVASQPISIISTSKVRVSQEQFEGSNFDVDLSEPMIAVLVFLYIVVFVIGVFQFKRHQKLR